MFLYWELSDEGLGGGLTWVPQLIHLPLDPDKLLGWRKRLYRAMYRVLLAGAVLARAYNEPFFLATGETPRDFLQKRGESEYAEGLPMTDQNLSTWNDSPFTTSKAMMTAGSGHLQHG
jgi:hypothetical protein